MPSRFEHPQQHPTYRLSDVAAIRLGFTPGKERRWDDADASRTASADFAQNTVLVVQPTSITETGAIDWKRLDRINVPHHQSFDSHLLSPGSVLLCLRGVMRVANLTEQSLEQDLDATGVRHPLVASSAWAVIRPDPKHLTADYLTWHLKQPSTAARLRAERAGSALQFIPLSAVQDMQVPVPQHQTQAAVVKVAALIDRLGQLEAERLQLLRRYVAGSLAPYSDEQSAARTRSKPPRAKPAR